MLNNPIFQNCKFATDHVDIMLNLLKKKNSSHRCILIVYAAAVMQPKALNLCNIFSEKKKWFMIRATYTEIRRENLQAHSVL